MANRERAARGLAPLVMDPVLAEAARQHSREMASLNYFDHISPKPVFQTPMDRYEWAGGKAGGQIIGENLFYGSSADVSWGHRSLMESPSHRDNLLGREFSRVGVGIHVSRSGEMWITQMFAGDSSRRTVRAETLTPIGG